MSEKLRAQLEQHPRIVMVHILPTDNDWLVIEARIKREAEWPCDAITRMDITKEALEDVSACILAQLLCGQADAFAAKELHA